ncbi:MAG: RnfABCDGE type electron transport complex subunit D [Clostridiales bacterium]|nr:RnfABCDGE type electron transport complex subunit D [Clostridiales bacterium]
MQKKLVVSSSPFLRNTAVSTSGIMLDVIIALLPTALAAVWFFGLPALSLIIVSVFFAVLSELVYQRLTHQKSTISDLSAVVTGLLLAFNIPANAPWWIAAIGSILAIILVKQIFGGLGQNFVNPALAARTILMLSWTGLMAATAIPNGGQLFGLGEVLTDAVAGATPLSSSSGYSVWQLFVGNVPGMLGETCKLTLLLGGIYLIVRRVIDWRVPVSFLVTAFVLFYLQYGVVYSADSGSQNVLYQLLSGGLILGAFFMATDYVTCPVSKWGRVIMGIGCALILFVIRVYNNGYPEGCSFGILFMNVLTPLIDKWTAPKSFGSVKREKVKKGGAEA